MHFLTIKHPALFALVLTALLAGGCSSTPTKVKSGPIKAQTFSFVKKSDRPDPFYVDTRAHAHTMIQDAISGELTKRGLSKVESGGDITVAYLVIVGNNATTELINDYFGYGRGAAELHDKAHNAYTSSKNPNYFEAGTLLVDIVDTKTYKILNRNYVVRPRLRNASDEELRKHIQDAVKEVLAELRVAE